MNALCLVLSVLVIFLHLLFTGETAWFIKETSWATSSFLTSIVIYNLTRRRIYEIQVLGFLYLLFRTLALLFNLVDKILMFFGIYILSDLIFYTVPLFLTILIFAYFTIRKFIKRWVKR